MLTVRFATGLSIQYNTAGYVTRHTEGHTRLLVEEGGKLIAQVPTAACVVEWVPACRVYMADESLGRAVDLAEKRIKRLERALAKARAAAAERAK